MDLFGASSTFLVLLLGNIFLSLCSFAAEEPSDAGESTGPLLQKIEGKVTIDGARSEEWLRNTFVSVDGGRYHGFLKSTGEFEIHGVAPGSYVVEVVSDNYVFKPQRVDISSKSGRVRARKVNFLNSKTVEHLPYPLKFRTGRQAEFFEKREPWSILSTLKNPMVRSVSLSVCIVPEWCIYKLSYIESRVYMLSDSLQCERN